jgi:CubicO group peptidase (beta-lactamase class C family)
MKTLSLTALFLATGSLCLAADRSSSSLPRSSPEVQGVSSPALLAFVKAADKNIDALHSFMLVRHGHVVAEGWWSPYGAESPHSLFSLSKSFTSTAVGLAIAEGKLRLDDEVLRFFPQDAPATPSKNLQSMRVSDLLRMSTGHQEEPKRPPDEVWTKHFLAQPVPFKPGTHFLYNTSGTYMLSAIVQKATGMTVLDYLRPRLFEPLGIDNPRWETSPQGISLGGYGLSIRTEDIARFGQLYLQQGKWEGKQLVPAEWVESATSRQTSNGSNPKSDWEQGYGYQFWRCRHGAYRGDGAHGQYCIVMPEQDAVIAITSGTKDMQAVLNLVWDKLLPAFKPEALSPDDDARKRLARTLAGLTLPPQQGSSSPPIVWNKKYVLPSNAQKLESISLESDPQTSTVTLVARLNGVERRISCGSGSWKKGKMAYGAVFPEQPVAASGAWVTDDTFKARICFYETPFILTLTMKFDGDRLLYDSETNVEFRPLKALQLVGKAE